MRSVTKAVSYLVFEMLITCKLARAWRLQRSFLPAKRENEADTHAARNCLTTPSLLLPSAAVKADHPRDYP